MPKTFGGVVNYNLLCEKGHYHYSPTPFLWEGKECGKALGEESKAGRPVRCHARMRSLVK